MRLEARNMLESFARDGGGSTIRRTPERLVAAELDRDGYIKHVCVAPDAVTWKVTRKGREALAEPAQ